MSWADDPRLLLGAVQRLLDADLDGEATRSRSCALLLRQALEGILKGVWARNAPNVSRAPLRVQLLCLSEYTSDKELARVTGRTWQLLSDACHHRGYGLPPSRPTLRLWLERVTSLHNALG